MRMENLIISVNAILPMFLVMALGYGARCLGWIRREEILNINKIAFRIFLLQNSKGYRALYAV